MDERSKIFLEKKGFKVNIHNPRRATKDLIEKSDFIFALDVKVLMELNRVSPKSTHKIKLLNYCSPKMRIDDPYAKKDHDYELIMERIESVCSDLVLP